MQIPKTVRLEENLELKVSKYLEKNGIKFSQLVNLAIDKFISEPQTIQLIPIENENFIKSAKRAFEKHKDTMDKLK